MRLHRLDLMTPPQFDCEQMVVNLTACDFWSQTLGSSRTDTITARGRKEKSDGAFSEAVMSHILAIFDCYGNILYLRGAFGKQAMCCRNHIAKMAMPFWLKLGTSYHKHLNCFRFALSHSFAMTPKSLASASSASAAAADTMEVDYGSDGSFELMDETFGEEFYQMAERVAEVAKCESDTVSMALAGTPVEDPAHPTLWTKVGLQKSLAALTAEMSRLQTKDTPA